MKKTIKNFIIILLFTMVFGLFGCNTDVHQEQPPQTPNMVVEYDEVVIYSKVGKIEVSSIYEDDEFYIESLNTKVIKILDNTNDNLIAYGVGLGTADVLIYNAYGDELTITITVEAQGEFAPPIDKIEVGIVEEGPYYVNVPYHIDLKIYPEVYNDEYKFIMTKDFSTNNDDYVIDNDSQTITFLRPGKITLSVFAEKKSIRTNVVFDVKINPNEKTYNILFIGNSLTYVHDIPNIIKKMLEADGYYVTYSQDTPGGSYLRDHETNFNLLIEKYNYSHVILQGQSYEPIDQKTSFLKYMEQYGNIAKKRGAEVIVYESWAYDKDSYRGLTKYQMTEMLRIGYEEAAALIGAKITRSGEAFRLFEETIGDTPSLYQDMNHQSLYGAYLSACVHYSTLTGNRASDNFYKMEGLDSNYALTIKRIADMISFPE